MPVDIQLAALFCGHFLGDFVFQTNLLVEWKNQRRRGLAVHALLVALLSWVLLGNLSAWWVAAMVFLLHGVVDFAKIRLGAACRQSGGGGAAGDRAGGEGSSGADERPVLAWLFADQLVHLLLLTILWYLCNRFAAASFPANAWSALLGDSYARGLLLAMGLTLGIPGAGVVLKEQMAAYAATLGGRIDQGLPRGGRTIGMLERLLVFMFVLAGKPEGAGFVIAAKSVFRIGQLSNREEKEQAEYIMIGTLRSFTYALAIAFVTRWLIAQV